jgi:hypothetical protein
MQKFFRKKAGVVAGTVTGVGAFGLIAAVVYPPIIPATLAWWWIIPCGINPATVCVHTAAGIGVVSLVCGGAVGVLADNVTKNHSQSELGKEDSDNGMQNNKI